jgi:hypothetical protein
MTDEQFIDEITAEQAKIDAGVRGYIDSMPVPDTLEVALLEREFWITEACRLSRNEDYYRGLVDRVAEALGPDAFHADDGTRHDEPIRAKVPELVEARLR